MFRLFVALVALALAAGPAAAQDTFPNRPITIVVTAPAGGANDLIARVLGEGMQGELRQPVIVDNRVGAAGIIGAVYAAKAAPNGYTLVIGTGTTHVVVPSMTKAAGYDPVKDFTPIVLVGHGTAVLVAGPSLAVKTLPEVIAAARARPGQVSFATNGPGGVYDLAALGLETLAGVKFNRVPYKGVPAATADLVGGNIDLVVGPPDGNMQNPKVQWIAALGSKRSSVRPDVPSAAEQGYPGFAVPVWAGVYAPANVPRPIVERLKSVLLAVMARPEVKTRIRASGVEVEGGDDAALARVMNDSLVAVRDIMKKANIVPE